MEENVDVQQVVDRIEKHCPKIRVKKCFFSRTQLQLLGHIIHDEGVRTDPEKMKEIHKTPVPPSVKDIPSFLWMAGDYRRFIFWFKGISALLHAATSNKRSF